MRPGVPTYHRDHTDPTGKANRARSWNCSKQAMRSLRKRRRSVEENIMEIQIPGIPRTASTEAAHFAYLVASYNASPCYECIRRQREWIWRASRVQARWHADWSL